MVKALLVDDSPGMIKTMQKLLSTYCPQVEVVGEAGSVDEAYTIVEALQPQVVFLDIEMPHGSGFDLLEKAKNFDFEVIFVTAFDHYALKAIKMCALDYLLKPVDPKELITAVAKAEEQIYNEDAKQAFHQLLDNLRNKDVKSQSIAIPTMDGLQFVSVNSIIRCEAEGNYTRIVLTDKTELLSSQRLKELEGLLVDRDFFRIHRSHLINIDYVRKYFKGAGGYILMEDGTHVDVARQKKESFLKCFNAL